MQRTEIGMVIAHISRFILLLMMNTMWPLDTKMMIKTRRPVVYLRVINT